MANPLERGTPPEIRSRTAAWARPLAALIAGTLTALALTELAFHMRDDGAFPHVNFYVPDPTLGVRLQPGASERISFAGNPVTSFRVNAQGYRGVDWGSEEPGAPTKGSGAILVIGDSQVFGLGVEEAETASAVLADLTNRVVYNAGVPTYGPPEYLALTKELLAARHPATVVVIVNLANDIFERNRPNIERHTLWDGWAVRRETAPQSVTWFPGRPWLMNQSHAVFGLRQWLATRDPKAQSGFASEGSARDLVPFADDARKPLPSTIGEDQIAKTIADSARVRLDAERSLASLLPALFPELGDDVDLAVEASLQHSQPGDIVGEQYAEEGRTLVVTAETLRAGVKLRAGMEQRMTAWVAAHRDDPLAAEVQHLLSDRFTSDMSLYALGSRVADALQPRSPLAEFVLAMQNACRQGGAELVVVALPIDVQVSSAEWTKYGEDPANPDLNMADTRVLQLDLVAAAEAGGTRALDAIDLLAAVEPGAFLDGDFHLTAKGQAALAAGIAAKLTERAPPVRPAAGLPEGRSRVPTPEELVLAPEITVKGSTRNRCSTRQLREWLYVDCAVPGSRDTPWVQLEAGSLETWTWAGSTARGQSRARLLTPLVPGRGLDATFQWPKVKGAAGDVPWKGGEAQSLSVSWVGGSASIGFTNLATPPQRRELPVQACDLQRVGRVADLGRGCGEVPGQGDRCEAVLACATGTRDPMPTCGLGQINAGAGGLCYSSCDDGQPCPEGQCRPWMSAKVCL